MTEKKTRKKRGGYHRDPLKKMIRAYNVALAEVRAIFERIASGAYAEKGNRPIEIDPPGFVDIVLLPMLVKLADALPEYDVEVPRMEEIEPDDKGCFPLRVAGRTVAGINFGGADARYIKVTLFTRGRPWGNPLLVDSMPRLVEIVTMVIQITSIPKKNHAPDGTV